MEQGGHAVPEAHGVLYGLLHGLRNIQPLHTLALEMDTGETHQIGNLPEGERTTALHIVAVFMKHGDKLSLTVRTFAL